MSNDPIASHTIQPGSYAAGRLRVGQTLRVTDVEGAQIADFFAWSVQDQCPQEMGLTAMVNARWALSVGDQLVDSAVEPIWTIVEDTAGKHLFGGGCCTRAVNIKAGVDQLGCVEIVSEGMLELGLDPTTFQQTTAANLFAARAYHTDGSITGGPPVSKAGDSITFRAEQELYWILVCCPYPSEDVNGGKSTPHRVDIWAEKDAGSEEGVAEYV
ncbi:MAG: urea carboxylase-associated family protein [Nocardioides sp.]|uniref:DUF1989 domain-containing protein n=1 Tax=Nocardioides sp. TaxID=35761 RepID=UPI0039E69DE8